MPTSFRSKTMSRQSVWLSKSLLNSFTACLSMRPLRAKTVNPPRAAVSILKAIDFDHGTASQSVVPQHVSACRVLAPVMQAGTQLDLTENTESKETPE